MKFRKHLKTKKKNSKSKEITLNIPVLIELIFMYNYRKEDRFK